MRLIKDHPEELRPEPGSVTTIVQISARNRLKKQILKAAE